MQEAVQAPGGAGRDKGTAALREENAALRNILDADIGGARAELGAVERTEGLLGALATTGDDDDDDAGSGDDDEEQTSPFDFSNLTSLVLDDGDAGGSGMSCQAGDRRASTSCDCDLSKTQ